MPERDELCGRVLGDFVLRERIGEGGFGAVYRCEQPLLGREAVVKVLHPDLHDRENIVQRFIREAQLASRLDHPYAAHIYAFGVELDALWIAMELVHGTPLDRWLRERGPLPLAQLVAFLERLAEVVHTAHERDIVHRDLKPSNIMVVERAGQLLPKLLDLGIAKLVDRPRAAGAAGEHLAGAVAPHSTVAVEQTLTGDHERPSPREPRAASTDGLTDPDVALGSPPYMAPEQWLDPTKVGPRTDLYALGVVTFEALVGRRPFLGATLSELAEQRRDDIPSLGDLGSPELERFFRRALAHRPDDRPATALELAAMFRVAAGGAVRTDDLPRLDEAVRDAWIASAPQPLAESVTALDSAHNAHQARDAARDLVRGVVRYLLVVALAARAQVRGEQDPSGVGDLLRALRRRELTDHERVGLLRMLVRSFAGQPDVFPIPEAVALLGNGDDDGHFGSVLALFASSDTGGGATEVVRSLLARLLPAVAQLLRVCGFVLDYPVVAASTGATELWMGLRRHRRPRATVHGPLAAGEVALLDRNGRVALTLSPLVQVLAPAGGTAPELFMLDGQGRHGARLVAGPSGDQHHDATVWDWFAQHVIGEPGDGIAYTDDTRVPYLGLAAFSQSDADRFVGREREIDAFTNRLRRQALQIVVGSSGAGKSSFVHAGVLPSLVGWHCVTLRPGPQPLAQLGARLAAAGVIADDQRGLPESAPVVVASLVASAAAARPIVLVIDQLEELFTLCAVAREREQFAATIAQLAASPDGPVRVICTLRDDFVMQVDALSALRGALSPALFLLGNPSRDDLIRTLIEPARRVGYAMSDGGLARDMVEVVADRPGALALLSFTASRLWEFRDRRFRQITRKAYDSMGGIAGALGRHAEDTFAALAPGDQAVARDVFCQLVTADNTRAVVTADDLHQRAASPRAGSVIARLVAARLIEFVEVETGTSIELVHEALIAAWPRLSQWTRENTDAARMREQVSASARQWGARDRPRGLLWRAEALADLERWRARLGPLTELERAFADASRAEASRARRLRRGLAIGAFGMLVIAVVVLLQLTGEARAQRERAQVSSTELRRQLADQNEEQGRLSLLAGNGPAALLYLLAALDAGAQHDVHFDTMLREAMRPLAAQRAVWFGHTGRVVAIDLSPDHTLLVSASDDGTALVRNVETGVVTATLKLPARVAMVRFDPSGRWILTYAADGVARLHSVAGELVHELRSPGEARPTSALLYPAFDPSGPRVATIRNGTTVVLWDVASGRELRTIETGLPFFDRLAFSGDGRTLAASGLGLVLVDTATGGLRRLEGHRDAITSIAFSPGDRWLVSASFDHTARVWEVASGKPIARLQGHGDIVDDAAISGSGVVATASRDHTARLWQAETGELLATLESHGGAVTIARLDHQGDRLVTASADGTAVLWDAHSGIELARFEGHAERIYEIALDRDRLFTAAGDGTVRRWLATPSFQRVRGHAEAILSIELSTDRSRIATRARDGTAAIWLADSGERLVVIPGLSAETTPATFSPDGRDLAVLSRTGGAQIWRDGVVRRTLRSEGVQAVVFGRAGTCVLVTDTGTVEQWDVETSTRLAEGPQVHAPITVLAALPASDRAMVALRDGTARIWEPASNHTVELTVPDQAPLLAAVVTPDERRIIASDDTGRVHLWDARGNYVHGLPPHAGRVFAMQLSRDGRYLVTAGRDGDARIWDLHSPDLGLRARLHDLEAITGVAFDPTGQILITGGIDDRVKLWRIATGRVIAAYKQHRGGIAGVVVADTVVVSAGADGVLAIRPLGGDPLDLGAVRRLAACLPWRLEAGHVVAKLSSERCELQR